MNRILIQAAELTLVSAIPIATEATDHSKLAGLQRRLQKRAYKQLAFLPDLTKEEEDIMYALFMKWGDATGWKKKKHIGSLASFCAVMLEQSRYPQDPGLFEILTEIVDHLINGKQFYPASAASGLLAAEKWQNIVNERFS